MDRRITNPEDSNVCSNDKRGYHPTLKGSNVYRKTDVDFYTTPKGSHSLYPNIFYKHQIPSGLLERMEAEIQKGLKELKSLM